MNPARRGLRWGAGSLLILCLALSLACGTLPPPPAPEDPAAVWERHYRTAADQFLREEFAAAEATLLTIPSHRWPPREAGRGYRLLAHIRERRGHRAQAVSLLELAAARTRDPARRAEIEEELAARRPRLALLQPFTGRRTVGAQVFVLQGKTRAAAAEELMEMARRGINTVIIRAFHSKGDRYHQPVMTDAPAKAGSPSVALAKEGVYFPTQAAPVVADLIGWVVDACHYYGMECYAWMNTRKARFGNTPREWDDRARDRKTRQVLPKQELDLFHPQVQAYLETLYRDLAATGVDGILFQDDLVYRLGDAHAPQARRALARLQTGTETDKKRDRILLTMRRLMAAGRAVKPDLRFAANVYYDTLYIPDKAYQWLAQSLPHLADLSAEHLAVMAYQRQMMQELHKELPAVLNDLARMTVDAVRIGGRPGRCWMKVQTKDWQTGRGIPIQEVVATTRTLLAAEPEGQADGIGIIFAPYTNALDWGPIAAALGEG